MARPREVLISEEIVIEAAIRIMESDGFDALSLRRLGTELKINSASLYYHFAGKDEILQAIARSVLREIDLPPLSDDWQDWIEASAVGYRRLLVARPWMIPLMLNGIRLRTLATAITEAKLAEAGAPAEVQPELIHVLDTTVVGSALVTIAAGRDHIDGPRFDHEKLLRRTIRVLLTGMMDDTRADAGKRRRAARN